MGTADRESRRTAIAEALLLAAERRFGAERAEALRPAIDEAAIKLAEVAEFPVDEEERPAFYMTWGERT